MNPPRVSDILGIINKIAPFKEAEDWDNVGLQIGDPAQPATRIMVALDPGGAAIDAAIHAGCNLLLTHHPFIFKPLKKISPLDPTGSLAYKAIRNDLAVVSLHTNLDAASGGVNDMLAALLDLTDVTPLESGRTAELVKLAVFVPRQNEEEILQTLFRFSGFLGNYRDCSFRTAGTGTFTPLVGSSPHIGGQNVRSEVEETKIEVLLLREDLPAALKALLKVHPYEEPAYDIYPLLNQGERKGLGRIGLLREELPLAEFADVVRRRLGCGHVRVVGHQAAKVRKVGLCGGSGMSLFREAARQGADVFVTGDVKYHEAREAQDLGVAVVDAGHFATEKPMIIGLAGILTKELEKRKFSAEVLAYEGEIDPFAFI